MTDSQNGRRGNRPGDPEAKRVEIAALRLLARREHSIEDLRRKLLSKGYDPGRVAAVMEKLTAKRLASDDRFAAGLVQHRARRGQGPVRIRADLRQQGVAESLIDQEFSKAEVDWNRLAAQVRRRKFGAAEPRTWSERAKQARFLQYRGFSADQIRAALGGSDELPAAGEEPSQEWPD
jgi:regulatory protein